MSKNRGIIATAFKTRCRYKDAGPQVLQCLLPRLLSLVEMCGRRPRRKRLHFENVRCSHDARELAKTDIMVIFAVVIVLDVNDVEQ